MTLSIPLQWPLTKITRCSKLSVLSNDRKILPVLENIYRKNLPTEESRAEWDYYIIHMILGFLRRKAAVEES